MANNSRFSTLLVIVIFAIMILSPFAPTTSASSEDYEDPIAFLPGWNLTTSSYRLMSTVMIGGWLKALMTQFNMVTTQTFMLL